MRESAAGVEAVSARTQPCEQCGKPRAVRAGRKFCSASCYRRSQQAAPPDGLLGTHDAADACGVKPATIASWCRNGWLAPTAGTARFPLYRLEDVEAANLRKGRQNRIIKPEAVDADQCVIAGCNGTIFVKAQGWCSAHQHRYQRYGDPLAGTPPRKKVEGPVFCRMKDCGNPAKYRVQKLCESHYKALKAAQGEAPPDKHGLSGYQYFGCRCDLCRQAQTEHAREEKARVRADPTVEIPHGTLRGYSVYACKCDACLGAHRVDYDRRSGRYVAEVGDTPHYGDVWTGAELEIVATRDDLSRVELARMLGRTVYAVSGARTRVRHDPKYIQVAGKSSA